MSGRSSYDYAMLRVVPRVEREEFINAGVVLYAADLGIYGNCVIVDHGLGVQSLYAHLSSIEVKEGDRVEKGRVLGRSGMTGLAGGDHLHFTMLVNGQAVNPVEWWDPKWMQDRVLRKIAEAGRTRVAYLVVWRHRDETGHSDRVTDTGDHRSGLRRQSGKRRAGDAGAHGQPGGRRDGRQHRRQDHI